jgi:hypothetical protein
MCISLPMFIEIDRIYGQLKGLGVRELIDGK